MKSTKSMLDSRTSEMERLKDVILVDLKSARIGSLFGTTKG